MKLTSEQLDLARTVRSVLERESGPDQVRAAMASPRGYDDKLWSVLCEQVGVAALVIPEPYGGLGAGVLELQLVAEELGRGCTPSPLLGTSLATFVVLGTGDDAASARLLPQLAQGALGAVVWAGADGRWGLGAPACTARDNGDGAPAVHGTAHYVLDADLAEHLLVPAHYGGELALFEVDCTHDGVRRERVHSMDECTRFATVQLDGVPAARLGTGDFTPALERARDAACAVLAAEQVGAASRALDLTVEYTKNRVQFGRPIGGFQALKHRMADLYVLVESARSAAYAAGEALDACAPAAGRAALTAKVYCSEAFTTVAAEMVQLHGGIAITWEHDAHLYFKRAHSSAQLFGQPHEHLARLGLHP